MKIRVPANRVIEFNANLRVEAQGVRTPLLQADDLFSRPASYDGKNGNSGDALPEKSLSVTAGLEAI